MVTFSAQMMNGMGFEKGVQGHTLRATFELLVVLQIVGLTLDDDAVIHQTGIAGGVGYRLALCRSAVDAAQALTGRVLFSGQDDGKAIAGREGPFVVVAVQSPTTFEAVDPYISNRYEDRIVTFKEFLHAKSELLGLRARALPPIQLALSSQLCAETGSEVGLKTVTSKLIGRTVGGMMLDDVQVSVHAELTVSTRRSTADLASRLTRVVGITRTLGQTGVKPYAAALDERDEFKRFMFCFLALEIETQDVFKRLPDAAGMDQLLVQAASKHHRAVDILRRQAGELRSLGDRFVWCALCKWPDVTDADIDLFYRLKKARDDIAHGNTQMPPAGYAGEAQALARKVLAAGR